MLSGDGASITFPATRCVISTRFTVIWCHLPRSGKRPDGFGACGTRCASAPMQHCKQPHGQCRAADVGSAAGRQGHLQSLVHLGSAMRMTCLSALADGSAAAL